MSNTQEKYTKANTNTREPPVATAPAGDVILHLVRLLAPLLATMALHHSGKKEILSFFELERRNVFDQNKALLAVRLRAMEREIQQLTSDYQPKEKASYARIHSQKIEQSAEEQEEQRNWHYLEPPPIALNDALARLPLHERPSLNKKKKTGKRNIMTSIAAKSVGKAQKHRRRHRQDRRLIRSRSEPTANMSAVSSRVAPRAVPDTGFQLPQSRIELRRGQLQVKMHRKARSVPLGGAGPRFPRPVMSGVMNGPNERTYNVKGFFGLHPKGEMVETFAWDDVRDADIIKGGAWNLRMLRYANERKASMAARAAAQKVKQSRRLKQQAKEELKIADQTDRRQSLRPRNWFIRKLESPETMVFQYTKGGQISCAVPPPVSLPKPVDMEARVQEDIAK